MIENPTTSQVIKPKVFISYYILGIYVGFVIFESLLVGLLPLSYNKSEPCQAQKNKLAEDSLNLPIFKNERLPFKDFKPKKPLISKSRNANRGNVSVKGWGEICEELLDPIPGEVYPWYSPRLPRDLQPLNYDIELFIPKWGIQTYDALLSIEISVLEPTSYIILHSKIDDLELQKVVDNKGNAIEVACSGSFSFFDYSIGI
jgi:hypothetical protein